MIASRQALPRFVQQGRAELIVPSLYRDSVSQLTVDSDGDGNGGTYTLRDADGTAVIDGASVSLSNGIPYYSLPSTFADGYALPQSAWRETWALTGIAAEPATAQTLEHEVYLCRTAPQRHIDAESLYQLHPQWRRQLPRSRSAGSLEEPITIAWEEMLGRLLGDGILPHRVLNWWALGVVHRYWAASIVCRDFATDDPTQSRWDRLAQVYWDRSQAEYERLLKLTLSDDDDGLADRLSVRPTAGPSPRQWRWGS